MILAGMCSGMQVCRGCVKVSVVFVGCGVVGEKGLVFCCICGCPSCSCVVVGGGPAFPHVGG